jgi:hypothetical protein
VQKNNSSIGIDKKYIDALLASPDESRPKQPAAQTFRPVETVKTAVQTVKSMFANPPKPSAQPAESSSYLKDLPTLQGTIKSAPQPSTTNVPDSSVTGFSK